MRRIDNYILCIFFIAFFIIGVSAASAVIEDYPISGFTVEPGDPDLISDDTDPPIIENHFGTSLNRIIVHGIFSIIGEVPIIVRELIVFLFLFISVGVGAFAYTRSKLSDDPNSRPMKILTCITENPGCFQIDIINSTNFSRGSVSHNLKRLEQEYKIKKISSGRKTLYYPSDSNVSSYSYGFKLLENENAKKIFLAILAQPNISQKNLGAQLNIPITTLRWHLKRLEKHELISLSKDQNLTCYKTEQKFAEQYFLYTSSSEYLKIFKAEF